jgi:hypothetical protein
MHPNVLALIRQLFNISTSDPTAATTTNSNQSTTDANTSITSTITNNASSTQDANTIYTKAAVDTDKTAMAVTLLSWIGEAKGRFSVILSASCSLTYSCDSFVFVFVCFVCFYLFLFYFLFLFIFQPTW